MLNPPFRSPRSKVAGLYHLGRMLDKIRLHLENALPEEYQPKLGFPYGLDGHLCGFLNVPFEDVVARVREGGSDDEIAEWLFARGLQPNKMQIRIWNGFASKFGWRDAASKMVAWVKAEDGMADRDDLQTSFECIDVREGRKAQKED